MKKNKNLQKLIVSGICLALCLVLPFLTGNIPVIGNAISPMHIPVLLCGFLCGPFYAATVGFIAPLLRFVMFGMPPIFPTGISMCFELAAYGLVSGLLYKKLPKKPVYVFVSLISAMVIGRIVWGILRSLLSGTSGAAFTWEMFFAGAFFNAIPGIIIQIILIPVLVLALRRSKLLSEG